MAERMDVVSDKAAAVVDKLGLDLPPQVFAAFMHDQMNARPGIEHELRSWCVRNGVSQRGAVVRVFADYKYSTIYGLYSAAGVPPAQLTDLYSVGLSQPDPVLAVGLTEEDTNMTSGGKQDSDQQFVATSHRFFLSMKTPPASVDADMWSQILAQWFNTYAIFNMGSQFKVIWGPIGHFLGPYPQPQSVNVNAAAVAGPVIGPLAPSSGGTRANYELKPPIRFNAGVNFRVQLRPPRGLQTVVGWANTVVQIVHRMDGYSRTAVQG